MTILRAAVGFVFFLLAFWLRSQTAGTAWFGLAIALSAVATIAGNALAPRIRARVREELMLVGALGLSAVAGIVAALMSGVGGRRRCWRSP